MRRLLFVLLLLAACGKGASGPVTPPASASASAQPRFDGVYAAQKGEAVDMIRFMNSGRALSISTASSAQIENAARLVMSESDRCAKGTYEIKDGIIRFALKSKLGTVEYAGAIKDDKLTIRWRSDINGASDEAEYAFVHVVDENDDAGAKPAAGDDDEDAGAPTIVAADVGLIPEGASWFCFRAPNASRCERKQSTCEASRKTAVAVRKDTKIAKCAKQASAFCFTVVQKSGGRGAASCSSSQADCDAERATLLADQDNGDINVSTCLKQ